MTATEAITLPLADATTIEAFYRAQTNTRTRFLQLSTGPATIGVEQLDLGEMRLLRAAGEGRHLWRDEMLSDEWRFAVLTAAPGGARTGSCEVTPTMLTVLRPGEALNLLTEGPYRTLEINVRDALIRNYGWESCHGTTADVPARLITALVSVAQAAVEQCRAASGTALAHVGDPYWSARICDTLDAIMTWWRDEQGVEAPLRNLSAQADVIARALQLLHDIDYARQTTVEGLTRDLGVSRRSLFLAFQKQLGLGPRRLTELVRLHELRARLYRAEQGRTTVSAEAMQLGFFETGRLAQTYRDVFGELPSQTLGRAA